MKYSSIYVFIAILMLIVGCTNTEKKNVSQGAIAKAYNQYLYLDSTTLNSNIKGVDSLNHINNIINNWMMNQIIIEQSKKQLSEKELTEIEAKVEAYKNDLYTFAYEEQITRQKMKTQLEDSLIENYYNQYITNYHLEEPYLKFIYVKCDKKAFVKEVEDWIKDSIDLYNLEDFCKEELQVCHLKPDKWISFKQFQNKLEALNIDKRKVQNGDTYLKIKEDKVHYLIRVLDFKDVNDPAPLSFVKNDIETILLNKKKVDFFNRLKTDLLKKEMDNGNVKVFE